MTCPADDMARLRAENDTLRETVRQLRAQLGLDASLVFQARCRAALGLTPSLARLLAVLLARPVASHDALLAALPLRPGCDDERMSNIVSVHICRMRPALARVGVAIGTRHALGYALSDAAKARLRGLLADDAPASAAPHPVLHPIGHGDDAWA